MININVTTFELELFCLGQFIRTYDISIKRKKGNKKQILWLVNKVMLAVQ